MASRAALVVISALCLSSLASAQLFGPPAVLKPLIAQLKAVNAKPGVYKYTSIVNLLQNRAVNGFLGKYADTHAILILCPADTAVKRLQAKNGPKSPALMASLLKFHVVTQKVTPTLIAKAAVGQGYNTLFAGGQIQKFKGVGGIYLGAQFTQVQTQLAKVINPNLFHSPNLDAWGIDNVLVPATLKAKVKM